jgi:hypothetical protein
MHDTSSFIVQIRDYKAQNRYLCFQCVKFSHEFREANQIADVLANVCLLQSCLLRIFELQCNATMIQT